MFLNKKVNKKDFFIFEFHSVFENDQKNSKNLKFGIVCALFSKLKRDFKKFLLGVEPKRSILFHFSLYIYFVNMVLTEADRQRIAANKAEALRRQQLRAAAPSLQNPPRPVNAVVPRPSVPQFQRPQTSFGGNRPYVPSRPGTAFPRARPFFNRFPRPGFYQRNDFAKPAQSFPSYNQNQNIFKSGNVITLSVYDSQKFQVILWLFYVSSFTIFSWR